MDMKRIKLKQFSERKKDNVDIAGSYAVYGVNSMVSDAIGNRKNGWRNRTYV